MKRSMKRKLFFEEMSDYTLVTWLCQYAGISSGYYRNMRKFRIAAEEEARQRRLPWKRASYTVGDRRVLDPERGMNLPVPNISWYKTKGL